MSRKIMYRYNVVSNLKGASQIVAIYFPRWRGRRGWTFRKPTIWNTPSLNHIPKVVLFVYIFCLTNNLFAQTIGGRIGAVLSFGQPSNRIGFDATIFLHQNHVQLSAGTKIYYNFQNYGATKKHWESKSQIGITGTWGKVNNNENPFYYTLFQQTDRPYAIGYQFLYYWNKVGTKQSSGSINIQTNQVHIEVENDAFGSLKGRDRFRTGGVRVLVQAGDFLYEAKATLWTGETRGKAMITCREPKDYPCRWGYRDISKLPYGKTSHGIFAFQVHYALPYRQSMQIGLGIDSEHIRDFLQNKIIHDMYFLPRSIVKTKNLHYPMLDTNGMPYLYQAEQAIRKDRFYGQIGLNNDGFY